MKRSLPSMIAGAALVAILLLYMITFQVRFTEVAVIRTFGEIRPPELLFSSTALSPEDLDKPVVSDDLRAIFDQNDISLSEGARLQVVNPDNEWTITDHKQVYSIKKWADQVNVYRPSKDVITEPGLYWKLPWPIQKVDKYDNRIHITVNTGEETPTRDEKNVIVTTAIGWKIDDPYVFSIRCENRKDGEKKLKTRVSNDQKSVISRYNFSNFVSTDTKELMYDRIEKDILAAVVPSAKELYGIRVESIGIAKLALPARITQTVFEAMKKERLAVAARYTSEGESTAKKIKDTAEGIAGTIMAFADRKAAEIVAKGREQAAKYNEIFREDEELAMYLLDIEKMKTLLKERSTVVLDANQRPLYLLKESRPAATSQPASPVVESGDIKVLSGSAEMAKQK